MIQTFAFLANGTGITPPVLTVTSPAEGTGNNGHWTADNFNEGALRDVRRSDGLVVCLPGSGALSFIEYCVDEFDVADEEDEDIFAERKNVRGLETHHHDTPHVRKFWEALDHVD